MKIAQSVRIGAWFLLALNIVMAFASIWIFMRMAPAIEIIIEQNEKSLYACEEMLSSLVLVEPTAKADLTDNPQLKQSFSKALDRAQNNITEPEEARHIEAIRSNYEQAFLGKRQGRKNTVNAIIQLAEINRTAMVKADQKARQIGNAGAWGIVFMASAVFFVGILFMRALKRSLVTPLEEIHTILKAVKTGEHMRRCSGYNTPQDIREIYQGINELLDKKSSSSQIYKSWGE